jgi:hypothetical protein
MGLYSCFTIYEIGQRQFMAFLRALLCTAKDTTHTHVYVTRKRLKGFIEKVLNGGNIIMNIILGNCMRPRTCLHEPTHANVFLLLLGCIVF